MNSIIALLFTFKGRINRTHYWLFFSFLTIVYITVVLLEISFTINYSSKVTILFALIVLWPAVAVQSKRWHDRNKSGCYVFVNLLPLVGPLWALIENGFLPGKGEENRYGKRLKSVEKPLIMLVVGSAVICTLVFTLNYDYIRTYYFCYVLDKPETDTDYSKPLDPTSSDNKVITDTITVEGIVHPRGTGGCFTTDFHLRFALIAWEHTPEDMITEKLEISWTPPCSLEAYELKKMFQPYQIVRLEVAIRKSAPESDHYGELVSVIDHHVPNPLLQKRAELLQKTVSIDIPEIGRFTLDRAFDSYFTKRLLDENPYVVQVPHSLNDSINIDAVESIIRYLESNTIHVKKAISDSLFSLHLKQKFHITTTRRVSRKTIRKRYKPDLLHINANGTFYLRVPFREHISQKVIAQFDDSMKLISVKIDDHDNTLVYDVGPPTFPSQPLCRCFVPEPQKWYSFHKGEYLP